MASVHRAIDNVAARCGKIGFMYRFRALRTSQVIAMKSVMGKIGVILEEKKVQKATGKLGFGSNLLKNKDRIPPRNPETQFL